MRRILLTGMSGTGKSSVIEALAARGHKAVDLDGDAYSEWVDAASISAPGTPVEPGRDWVWRESRVRALLDREDAPVLFVSGCAANMRAFLPRFDNVVLLSAPPDVILERLARRTNNPYGKRPDEAARVLDLIRTVEPLLRRSATCEIDTRMPLEDVVRRVLDLMQEQERGLA